MLYLEIKIRVACSSLIYNKVLKLSKTAFESETTVGQIINHLNNDTKCITEVLACINYIWIGPVQTLLIAYLIYKNISLTAVAGIIVFFITIPIQGYLAKIVPRLSLKAAAETDKRLSLTNETVSGIQIIKMFAWEKSFLTLVDIVRAKEMTEITKIMLAKFAAISCYIFNSRISLFVSLVFCVLFDKNLSAESVFILTMYFDTIQNNMNAMFPFGLQRGGMWLASMKRIQKFLEQKETQHFHNVTESNHHHQENSGESVRLQNVSARWSSKNIDNTLENINFSAKFNSLVAIVGQVGSGKTSLLQVILQELPVMKGIVKTVGQIAYVSQDPWIFSSSIRQNIIFAKPMDKQRYENVIKVCQLERDFALFPHKDQTIVGEKGINLSGGQRARIALARAVYADADIYLLDDPLSAVDARVGRLIFNDCIRSFLKNKTCILVTHQLQYLNQVDYIYVLENGHIQEEGTSNDLQSGKITLNRFQISQEEEDIQPLEINYQEFSSDQQEEEVAEHRTIGKVSKTSYISYFKASQSTCLVIIVFLLAIFRQIISSSGDFYIARWAEAQQSCSDDTTRFICSASFSDNIPYISIYGGLTLLLIILVYSYIFTFAKMCKRSSQKMHFNLFERIVRARMGFFYDHSSGRILNRFSKDIGVIDKELPVRLYFTKISWMQVLVIIGMTIILNYWLVIPTIIAGFVMYLILHVYIRTSRNIKRLDGITQSPVIRHLSDTLQGLESVRAFGAEDLLIKEFQKHLDLNTSSSSIFLGCAQCLQLYVELVFGIYIAAVAYIFLLMNNESTIANVGLIITQIIILADTIAWSIFNTTETETLMTSVERILEYSNIEQEPPLESAEGCKPCDGWPKKGCVEFKNVSLRYHVNGKNVLENLNFSLRAEEKIGIVGRTGAGKSSLIAALFQMSPVEGEIFIDGVASSCLGLHDLRSKISIIPQQPLLFAGTLRRNLDPFDEYSDDILWQALEEVELKTTITGSSGNGLNSYVSDGGSNFSMGQRQLLCLARAIVRNNKILILDEATANVDLETDFLIQSTIRRRFENCTVLIIAHRLNTIMDCDRIMVLDAGKIVEFDSPSILMGNEDGLFFDMVQQTGHENANNLKAMMGGTKL
ncbi:probable multidrug resistance-associated protein lethal(2)03659 [Leptopilina boulardi]|uniref:probable multidrug resistance-associated protein lethal(2)03659 n=1 Tax=Leptopilina boulardi TaxID=63433 RepID=UPI0021F64C51|nr:probable multidrug resistance-associated protein lethal(2)03659 [Leptopilina boulardi]